MGSESKPVSNQSYDVVICGAGLAGLTLARQLKRELPDLSILQIDRLRRPLPVATFKVGESTNEIGAHYLRHTLDLADYLDHRHLRKLGLRYFFGDATGPFENRPEFGLSDFAPVSTYQIDRGIFENDLREFNLAAGVEILEGCQVKAIRLAEGDEPHQIIVQDAADASTRTVASRWVIDASGRRRLLQRMLGLAQKPDERYSAAWFRLEGRIDISDFVPVSDVYWHGRVKGNNRFYSTNHLMGDGYWVWLIALSGGCTSIGIVATSELHQAESFNTYTKAMNWLRRYEPSVAAHIDGLAPLDFLVMRSYSYSTSQIYSHHRWACIGEAGAFADPFYSPGIDQIGLGNLLTLSLIKQDLEGDLERATIDEANLFYLSYHDNISQTIHRGYPFFGKALVMGCKLLWDFAIGWALNGPLMFNSVLLKKETLGKVRKLTGKNYPLATRMQNLFQQWSLRSQGIGAYEFFDYLSIPAIRDLRLRNLQTNKDEQEILADHLVTLELLEELAQVIFLLAVEDAMPEALERFSYPIWLNAWAISLDEQRWSSDGLFSPQSRPRNLSRLTAQIRRAIIFQEQPANQA